jgi:DNA-binding transcriptional LysR family regulator
LHVAQAAISKTLSNLEEGIGVKLLSRAARAVELTPEGQIFYTEAGRTLEQARLAPERSEARRTLAPRISGTDRTFFKPTKAEECETWLTFACNAYSTEMNVP